MDDSMNLLIRVNEPVAAGSSTARDSSSKESESDGA